MVVLTDRNVGLCAHSAAHECKSWGRISCVLKLVDVLLLAVRKLLVTTWGL